MLSQVFDFNGHVIAELREFTMRGFDNGERVPRSVEEVRIAERDVLRASVNLLADIIQHDVALNHAERAVVHWHDRTVPAKMFASRASLPSSRQRAVLHRALRCVHNFQVTGIPDRSGTKGIFAARNEITGSDCPAPPLPFAAPSCRLPSARLTSPSSNSPPRIVPTPSPRR